MRQDKAYRSRYNACQEELKLWQRKESFHHGNNLEHINSVIKHVLKAFLKTSLVAQMVRRLPEMQETRVQSLGREDLQWQPLQYSCLENSMDRGVWWATVHGVAKNRTQLNNFIFTFTETLTTNQAVLEAVDTTDTPIQRKDIQTRKREQSTINAIGEHTMGAQKEKHLIGRRGFHKWCHWGSQCLSWISNDIQKITIKTLNMRTNTA